MGVVAKEHDRILSLNLARSIGKNLPGYRQFGWTGDLQIDGTVYQTSLLAGFGRNSGRISVDLTHPIPGHIETIRFSIIQRSHEFIINTSVLNEGEEVSEIEPTHTHLQLKRDATRTTPLTVSDIAITFPSEGEIAQNTATTEQLDLYHMWELGDALTRKLVIG
jgi:hypothetical protein